MASEKWTTNPDKSFTATDAIVWGISFERINLKLLISISVTVILAAVPLALFLMLYFSWITSFSVAMCWCGMVIRFIYLAHDNPHLATRFVET